VLSAVQYEDIAFLIALPAGVGIPLTQWIGTYLHKRGAIPHAVHAARVVVSFVWISIVLVGIWVAFGPFSFLSALTFSAIVGVAVSLALQTTLQNIIAGFLLLRHGFLHLDDKVQFSGIKGTIANIGIVSVIIKLEDGSLATVSNSNLLSGPLINFSATTRFVGEY
jgi:small-conductance mechanosensitive channel